MSTPRRRADAVEHEQDGEHRDVAEPTADADVLATGLAGLHVARTLTSS